MSAESPATKFLPLGDVMEEKELQIADPVPVSNGYNKGYYIGRIFRYQKTIKQVIFKDKDVRDSHIYLARSEEEYTNLCQLHPKKQCLLSRERQVRETRLAALTRKFRNSAKIYNNNVYLLQLGCYSVAVVILHVYKT
jgi:hypothetical protein